ncbi:MAG TPA: VWA domain-containing protein, partial [Blastocatellia bacterium]|nr:VWA domain-containing protein [Blastocatellia bacterium]
WRESADAAIGASYFVSATATGETYGMISRAAPANDAATSVPRDVLFVLDRSGSMGTEKMASAARACAMLLDGLGPADRFAILAFDTSIEWFNDARFAHADAANRDRGSRYLRGIESRGGTEMNAALDAALGALAKRGASANERETALILLTDGEIGDESRVLANIQNHLGRTRLFTVGIDTAVNDGFLRRIAKLGRGTATFVEPGADLDRALVAISREIGRPVVSDITVVAENGETIRLAPERVPDLFDGRRATVFLSTPASGRVRVTGRLATGGTFDVTLDPAAIDLPAIAHLWGRARVTDLEDRYRIEPAAQDELKAEIIDVSVRLGVLSRFTAFVVVDEHEVVVTDGSLRHVVQPVEMPAMWAAPAAKMQTRGVGALYSIGAPMFSAADIEMDAAMSMDHVESAPDAALEKPGILRSIFRRAISLRRPTSIDDWVRNLRAVLDTIRKELADGDAPSVDQLDAQLVAFHLLAPTSENRVDQIVQSVEHLIEVLRAGNDPTEALAKVDKALEKHTKFWERSI